MIHGEFKIVRYGFARLRVFSLTLPLPLEVKVLKGAIFGVDIKISTNTSLEERLIQTK